jgi:hypothetical protein
MAAPPKSHFVAYHNVDERGSRLWRGEGSGSFETSKPSLPRKGDVLWCFEGEGRPKTFTLVKRGIVTKITRNAKALSLVRYRTSSAIEPAEVNSLSWFPKLFRSQGSFGFGLNAISDPDIVDQLEGYAAANAGADRPRFTELCAYTLKHSSDLDKYGDGETHTIETKGRIWARFVKLLADRKEGEVIPVLFAPAEKFVRITGCADLVSVRTAKKDGINSFTFTNFRRLSPPLLKASLKRDYGEPLGGFRRDHAICRTPKDLADRCVLSTASADQDVALIEKDKAIPETSRKALIDARLGQGKFRQDLEKRWDGACAVTGCSIREVLRASHIRPWARATNEDRLDPQNGLLLLANLDILFEKGFVSFDNKGRMLVSKDLSAGDRRLFGLPMKLRRPPDEGERRFLAQHRKSFKFPG